MTKKNPTKIFYFYTKVEAKTLEQIHDLII